jgi:hypothetical protein
MVKYSHKSFPKFFPFSAGVQWKIEKRKYVIPKVDSITWNDVIKDKPIIVTAFGGLLESFISLSALEVIKVVNPSNRLYWKGNDKYSDLVSLQGLANLSDINITKSDLYKYPVPIFFDTIDNVYFNLLNNYLERISYWGSHPEKVNKPVIEQIFSNTCLQWNNTFPKLRKLGNDFLDNLYKTGKLKHNVKIICVILDDGNNLNWNIHNLKELSQLVSIQGAKVIVFTRNSNLIYNTNLLVCEYNIRNILQVITSACIVLSSDISWEIIAMMISKAKLISGKITGPLNLIKNAEYVNADNDIFLFEQDISPIDVFNIYKG